MTPLEQILLAIVGSTAFSSLVQFFVNRHDQKKHFGDKLNKLEKDDLRSQLLLLILLRPEEQGRMIRKLLGLLHQYSDIEESDIFEVQQMEGPEDPRAVKR